MVYTARKLTPDSFESTGINSLLTQNANRFFNFSYGTNYPNAYSKKTLQAIASDSIIQKHFYLTGGTALSEYYLHHRLSEDLDFFSETDVDSLWLSTFTKKIKAVIGASTVDSQKSFNRNLIFFHIGRSVLKTEFTYFPFTQIEKAKTINILHVDSLLDIAVNKFFTIYQQPVSRHFIDLYCILQKSVFRWKELGKLARIKFDVAIDPLQLGSQLYTAKNIGQLPHMITPLNDSMWRTFFLKSKGIKKRYQQMILFKIVVKKNHMEKNFYLQNRQQKEINFVNIQ